MMAQAERMARFHDIALRLSGPACEPPGAGAEEPRATPGNAGRTPRAASGHPPPPGAAPRPADEQLIAPLRALLSADLAEGRDWSDLGKRLKRKGYALCAAAGGLALHTWPDGARICDVTELGFCPSRLMRRAGAPAPGAPAPDPSPMWRGGGRPVRVFPP